MDREGVYHGLILLYLEIMYSATPELCNIRRKYLQNGLTYVPQCKMVLEFHINVH